MLEVRPVPPVWKHDGTDGHERAARHRRETACKHACICQTQVESIRRVQEAPTTRTLTTAVPLHLRRLHECQGWMVWVWQGADSSRKSASTRTLRPLPGNAEIAAEQPRARLSQRRSLRRVLRAPRRQQELLACCLYPQRLNLRASFFNFWVEGLL